MIVIDAVDELGIGVDVVACVEVDVRVVDDELGTIIIVVAGVGKSSRVCAGICDVSVFGGEDVVFNVEKNVVALTLSVLI